MKKKLLVLVERAIKKMLASLLLAVMLASCSDASLTDLKEPKEVGTDLETDVVTANVPEKVDIYRNIDNHPTVVALCIKGLGWATISDKYSGDHLFRVPEWDAECTSARNLPTND